MFLCVVALAPLCPMVAPFSLLYFLFITPLLKWGHIFVYRPTFDAGGMRWPLLHDILMYSVVVSQVRMRVAGKALLFQISCFMIYWILLLLSLDFGAGSTGIEFWPEESFSSGNDICHLNHSNLDIQKCVQRYVWAKLQRCCVVADKRTRWMESGWRARQCSKR